MRRRKDGCRGPALQGRHLLLKSSNLSVALLQRFLQRCDLSTGKSGTTGRLGVSLCPGTVNGWRGAWTPSLDGSAVRGSKEVGGAQSLLKAAAVDSRWGGMNTDVHGMWLDVPEGRRVRARWYMSTCEQWLNHCMRMGETVLRKPQGPMKPAGCLCPFPIAPRLPPSPGTIARQLLSGRAWDGS